MISLLNLHMLIAWMVSLNKWLIRYTFGEQNAFTRI